MKPCFIDVHCHLDLCKGIPAVIAKAKKAGAGIIVTQGTNKETNRKALELAQQYPEVKAALGLYPIDALQMSNKELEEELTFIRKNKEKIVAIGEVGMDFKEDEDEHETQARVFSQLIKVGIELDKPIIVHSRKAELACIELLEKYKAKKVIMHCFSGKRKLVERIIQNGWYLTIPTSAAYATQFQEYALLVPLEQVFCETDAPFLHPDKGKGITNEPGNVSTSYNVLAQAKHVSLEEVTQALCANYQKLFLE